jgi:site-specific DNA recombinase
MGRKRKEQKVLGGSRAIIYLRVSTDEQVKHGSGLDAQLALCQSYCVSRDYTVVAIMRDEGISGRKHVANRPGLRDAQVYGELGTADVLVCYAQDRLARGAAVFEQIYNHAKQYSYRLETARDQQNLMAAENELPADIQAFMAQFEAKLIAKRLYGGRKERSKRDGTGSGPLPWGYRRQHKAAPIEVDPDAQPAIQMLLRLRERGYTYQKVADALNAAGYSTQRGKAWTTGLVLKVEQNADLYRTGRRVWHGIVAKEQWPVVV